MSYTKTVVSINMVLLFLVTMAIIAVVIGVFITLDNLNIFLNDLDDLVIKVENIAENKTKIIENTLQNGLNQILDKCTVINN